MGAGVSCRVLSYTMLVSWDVRWFTDWNVLFSVALRWNEFFTRESHW